ncbi:MAG TPA: lysylphosphatidylglycerol synthase transmembrane domain-containing protein [Acidobacteriota bacterium]
MKSFARRSTGKKKRGRAIAALVLPAAVSAVIIWLLMRGLSWQRLAGSILSASPWRLALYGAISLVGLWLRAVRFRMLLPDPKPAPGPVFLATAIQNALGDLVPARLASLGSYVWFMKRRLDVAVEAAASTFIVSFVLDLVTLGPLLLIAVALRFGSAAPAGEKLLSLEWAAAFGAVFFVVSTAAAWWLGPLTSVLARLLRALARGRGKSVWTRAAAFLERIAASMENTRRSGALAPLLAISLAIRLAKYASLFALTESLLAGTGYASPHPNPWDLVIGVSATELIASLPIPAIGQFGIWEGGMVGVLVMMGFAREPATLVAFGVHGITTAYEYLLALLALGGLLVLSKKRIETPPSR